MRLFGIPTVLRSPEDGGGAPAGSPPPSGAPPTPPPAAASAAPPAPTPYTPPWGSDPSAKWMINEKPWYETVYPDGPTKESMRAKDYANPVVVGDAYLSASKLAIEGGKDRVAIPAADASPEDWNKYYEKRGRLEAPDKYEIKSEDPNTPFDPNMVKIGQKMAFELGMTPGEAGKMAKVWNEMAGQFATEQAQAEKTANDAAIEKLYTTYGGKAEVDANLAKGREACNKLGLDPNAVSALDKALGSAPTIDLLVRLGKLQSEGKLIDAGGGNSNAPGSNPEGMSPQGAKAEIDRLQTDAGFQKAYGDRHAPGHAEAVTRMNQLFAKAGSLALG